MIQLRPFQEDVQEAVRESLRQPGESGSPQRRVIMQMPTGAGKTVTGSSMIHNSQQMGFRSMFVVHGRQLVYQASRTLSRYGINHGVMMAGAYAKDVFAPTQVCSIDTLASWVRNGKEGQLPPADLILADEAHESTSNKWTSVLDHYPRSVIVGLTATPERGNGRGLGDVYEDIVLGPSVKWLTGEGYLVPAEYYSIDIPNLEGVAIQNGDYVGSQLDAHMSGATLVGDVVTTWRKHAMGKPTIVFAAGVKHSKFIAEAFNSAGIAAFHIDANTPQDDRDAAFRAIESGDLKVLCNNRVLNRGFDCPAIEVCIDAAPTRSHVMHLQKLGRVLRTHEGKDRCIILDHAGNIIRHGPVTREFDWTLDPGEDVEADRARERLDEIGREVVCASCGFVFSDAPRCPRCGAALQKGEAKSQDVERIAGELRRLTPEFWEEQEAARKAQGDGPDVKREWYGMLAHEAKRRGNQLGWAAHVYRARFDAWPNHHIKRAPEQPASIEVLSFVGQRKRRSS